MPLGITHTVLDPLSGAALVRDDILLPIAADDDYFSSATAGGAQGGFVCAASVLGDSVLLSAQAARPLFYARVPSVTLTNAGGSLTPTATIRIEGKRFGKTVTQDVVCVAGSAVSGTKLIDEITSAKFVAITNMEANDTIKIGVNDSWLGLRAPIKSYRSVKMILKVAAGTPDASGPKMTSDLSTTLVKGGLDSGINMKSLYSSTAIAVTDRYLVEYSMDGAPDFFPRTGKRLGG